MLWLGLSARECIMSMRVLTKIEMCVCSKCNLSICLFPCTVINYDDETVEIITVVTISA